jgi:hypothetical protein
MMKMMIGKARKMMERRRQRIEQEREVGKAMKRKVVTKVVKERMMKMMTRTKGEVVR